MAEEIKRWLEDLGLDKYADVFVDNEISLAALPHLTQEDLKELGLPMGPRKIVVAAIAALGDERLAEPAMSPGNRPASQHQVAERRQIAVLFADLVGSTAMSARTDPEDMRDLGSVLN